MAITVSLYEESGAPVSGRGSTIIETNNIGWKSSGSDETNEYVYNPISRPTGNTPFAYSFKKINFIKIEGTWGLATRVRFKISGDLLNKAAEEGLAFTNKVRLFYKITNVYEAPSNAFAGDMMYIAPGETITLYPALSLEGPNTADQYLQHIVDSRDVVTYVPRVDEFGAPVIDPGTGLQYIDTVHTDTPNVYYSQYLVTQLFVEQGEDTDFGNLGELNIECYVDEYEDTNI